MIDLRTIERKEFTIVKKAVIEIISGGKNV